MVDLNLNRADEQKTAELQNVVEQDEAAEASVRHKLDWHLMPLFFVICE